MTATNVPEPTLSWSAILAGAAVALATSVFLTLLAAGFGVQLVTGGLTSPGSLNAFTPEIGAGAVAVQVLSAGFGGYLAGRLRHAWPTTHADEAHFRDTAQGLIAWAVATLAGLLLAALVLTPAAEHVSASLGVPPAAADPVRAAQILAQSAFFAAVGMILGAFIAAVAGRLGGLRAEEMAGQAITVVVVE